MSTIKIVVVVVVVFAAPAEAYHLGDKLLAEETTGSPSYRLSFVCRYMSLFARRTWK